MGRRRAEAGAGDREGWERRRGKGAALAAPEHSFQALPVAVTLDLGPPQVTSCHATAPKATAQL